MRSNSSHWLKSQGLNNFAWQRGYACFSVGKSQAAAVAAYIRNQAEHHRHVSYQEEVREFLERYEVAFDERYVWDQIQRSHRGGTRYLGLADSA